MLKGKNELEHFDTANLRILRKRFYGSDERHEILPTPLRFDGIQSTDQEFKNQKEQFRNPEKPFDPDRAGSGKRLFESRRSLRTARHQPRNRQSCNQGKSFERRSFRQTDRY